MKTSKYNDSILKEGWHFELKNGYADAVRSTLLNYGYSQDIAVINAVKIIGWESEPAFLRYRKIIDLVNAVALLQCQFVKVKLNAVEFDDSISRSVLIENLKTRVISMLSIWDSPNYKSLLECVRSQHELLKSKGLDDDSVLELIFLKMFESYPMLEPFWDSGSDTFKQEVNSILNGILKKLDSYFDRLIKISYTRMMKADKALLAVCQNIFSSSDKSYSEIIAGKYRNELSSVINWIIGGGYDEIFGGYVNFADYMGYDDNSPERIFINRLSGEFKKHETELLWKISPISAAQYFYFVLTEKIIAPKSYLPNTIARVIFDLLAMFWGIKDTDGLSDEEKKKRIRRYLKTDPETGQYLKIV